MLRAAEWFARLTSWRRYLAAFLAGGLSLLAFAPLHAWPVMFATVTVLVWLLDGAVPGEAAPLSRSTLVRAGLTGWWFGFGYFLFGLYWIGFAFLVEAEIFAVFLPFAVTLMPAGLALFFAAACACAAALWRPGLARVVALAIAFAAFEWLRGKLLTGFPWNTIGYALTGNEAMMQWASVFGVYTLSLFAVLIFAVPAVVWSLPALAETRRGVRFGAPAVALCALAAAMIWGQQRLQEAPRSFVDGVRLRIVQPNIPQAEKWKPENRAAVFQRYLEVSRQRTLLGGMDEVTHLLWPESAVPFLLADTPEALDAISALLPGGATFITGAARGERSAGGNGLKVYNSVFVMDDAAKVTATYDKVHLVPFGEYLPFQETLESLGLSQLTRVRGGFTPGAGTRMLKAPGLPEMIALICYEIIFPEQVREEGARPGLLLNVTNDAWFGDSSGPHQHFHQSRVRAVEQGLPLVRAANNGISAVVDPYGRIVGRVPRNRAVALDAPLPAALTPGVFVRHGRLIFVLALLSAATGYLLLRRRGALGKN